MASFSLIPGRVRDLGGFTVNRTLPSISRRLVGPFVFWDHMGPATLEAGHGMDVRPHPHINLATVTYLFAGEIVHKDSLGSTSGNFNGAAVIGNALYAVGRDSNNGGDYLIAKYNTDGSIAWSESFGGSGADVLNSAVALNSHLYAVG